MSRFSVLLRAFDTRPAQAPAAVRALHKAFELEEAQAGPNDQGRFPYPGS